MHFVIYLAGTAKHVLSCCSEPEPEEASLGSLFYLQVMDKISASFVFSMPGNVSAPGVSRAISAAPARKKPSVGS